MRYAASIAAGALLATAALGLSHSGGVMEAGAQTAAGAGGTADRALGIGGTAPNQNDLCWVLERRQGKKGPETHLALYRAVRGGQGRVVIQMQDARLLDYDMQLPWYVESDPSVRKVKKLVESIPEDKEPGGGK